MSDFIGKDVADCFFKVLTDTNNRKWKDGVVQMVCTCGNIQKKPKNGYTNLTQHVKTCHEDWEDVVKDFMKIKSKGQKKIDEYLSVTTKARNLHSWIQWIIEDDLPFSFVEKKRTRENVLLKPISRNTLMKYLRLTTAEVEQKVKESLPNKFGLVLDGWTANSTHFVCLFACIPGESVKPMLSFSPLLDETNQSSENHKNWIVEILGIYGKDASNILFLLSDNTNTMPKIARLLGCPFIGCTSHRLALFVKDYLGVGEEEDDETDVILKVRKLMKKLKSANKSAALRLETHLRPVLSNATRWSSTFEMIQRYNQIVGHLNRADVELVPLLLSPAEDLQLKRLEETLKKVNDVTVKLQGDTVNLETARTLLDGIVKLNIPHSNPSRHITPNAEIVVNFPLENGIVKVLDGNLDRLTTEEKHALRPFERNEAVEVVVEEVISNYADALLQEKKKSRINSSPYYDLSFIPATSVICEREFSGSSLVYTELRQSMTPYHLECVRFLKSNLGYWNSLTIQKVLNDLQADGVAENIDD